uniref:Uncharacterized protein n=1 Tax=Hippocampus comes TaxID=109280 RepID=A0A3Q2XK08_HIPCM
WMNIRLSVSSPPSLSGPSEASRDVNYGGVYVGLPADLTTVAASQSKSSRKGTSGKTLTGQMRTTNKET